MLLWVALVSVSLAGSVHAQEADGREAAAMRACLAGDVKGGVSLLAELYQQSGDATALYNQARCFQWNARYDEALGHFREYLRQAPALSEGERAEVNQHIAEVERARAPGPLQAEAKAAPAPETPSRALLTAAEVSAAAGAVLVGLGTGFAVQGQNQAVAVATAPVYDPARAAESRQHRTVGAVMLAAGGAALLAGAVLWLVHRQRAVAPTGNGLALVGTF